MELEWELIYLTEDLGKACLFPDALLACDLLDLDL